MTDPKKVLFLTWDGDAQSYLTSLFLPIFSRLKRQGVEVHIMQFSFAGEDAIRRTRELAEELGIPYVHHPTPRRFRTPLIPAISVWGAMKCVQYTRQHRIDAWMPRSLVPAGIALLARQLQPDTPIVFDADGLMADERVDFAGWSRNGAPYRALRMIEKRTLEVAHSVFVRTRRAREILLERVDPEHRDDVASKTVVIPNLKDEQSFAPRQVKERGETRQRLGIEAGSLMIVTVGSLAAQYYPEAQAAIVKSLIDEGENVHWVILTGHEREARELVAEAGIPEERVTVTRVPAEDVPDYVSSADVGLALRAPTFSQQAVCPIKVAEYLLCGTPVIATKGVGDVAEHVTSASGLLLEGVSPDELRRATEWIREEVVPRRSEFRDAAREIGLEKFAMSCAERLYAPVFSRV